MYKGSDGIWKTTEMKPGFVIFVSLCNLFLMDSIQIGLTKAQL